MKVIEKIIDVDSIITKSKLPDADYVINPYIGCPHKCIYCYAEFMKRFTNHFEPWGDFLDIKKIKEDIPLSKYTGTSILLGSVTDAYNPFEAKYKCTQKILNQLVLSDAKIDILTKSSLVIRDIDLIRKIKNIRIGISMNTLNDDFRKIIEPFASPIDKRIITLKKLKEANISTYLFMSPIFPGITNFEEIIQATREYVDIFCFENLNLRAGYKYEELIDLYDNIYLKKNNDYWNELIEKIENFCKKENLKYKIYFYHSKARKK